MQNLLSVFGNVLPALVVFGILIIVHEWGHFIACRLRGVKVEKFSIGFGPELFGWRSRETHFVVSAFPLGGFVKPAGEDSLAVGTEGAKPGDFLAASVGSRMMIVAAGVVMNFFLAFVIFSAVYMIGRPLPGTVIGGFIQGYPAATSGLESQDKILKVDGTPVATWKDVLETLDRSRGASLSIEVLRGEKVVSFSLSPQIEETRDVFGKKVTLKRVGITPDPEVTVMERYGFFRSIVKGGEALLFHTTLTYKAIYYICTRQLSPKNLMGPLGIIQVSGQAARAGVASLLLLTAILSVSLAVINLFPIPALDGGHLVFLLIEALFRKPVPAPLQEKVTNAGFFALMGLMVLVFYNDIVNLQILDKLKNLLHISGS